MNVYVCALTLCFLIGLQLSDEMHEGQYRHGMHQLYRTAQDLLIVSGGAGREMLDVLLHTIRQTDR